jgi:hypothetical protein
LDRSAVVEHLILMAAVLSASALLMGVLAERLRRAGIPTELFLAGTLALSMAAQLGLVVGLPLSSYLLFGIIAAGGASAVLSFAILARYFPREIAGRANAALGVLNLGTAFALQYLSGLIIAQWPADGGHYAPQAHEAAMGAGLALQLISLAVFFMRKRKAQPISMAYAVTRVLGVGAPTVVSMPSHYRAALSAWRRHVAHTRRRATAWRCAAVASMALCVCLGGALSLALVRPAVALHAVENSTCSHVAPDRTRKLTDAPTSDLAALISSAKNCN